MLLAATLSLGWKTGALAQSAFEAPPYANASVAGTDDAGGLFVNPAAAGLRRGSELVISRMAAPSLSSGDARARALLEPLWRGALVAGPVGFTVAHRERGRTGYGLSIGGGDGRSRFGIAINSLTASSYAAGLVRGSDGLAGALARGFGRGEDRVTDLGLGTLSRPAPWLSLGATIDHLGEPRLGSARLDREYTAGVGLRPLAAWRARAHTLGPSLTLTADVRLREDDLLESARVRVGGELELAPGILLRGAIEDHGAARFGVTLLGVRSSLHADAADCQGCGEPAATYTAAFHSGEERTMLAALERRRVAVLGIGGELGDDALSGFSFFGATRTRPAGPIHRQLERALEDPLTRGVLLELGGVAGMAQLEELRPRIRRLREAGKPVVAYLEDGGGRADLYLAAACDRIVTTPEAFYVALGLHAERRYYRRALADWGIRVDRASHGKYKSAYRNFSVDSTSDADRESIERQLDVAQELFVSAVARDRQIDEEVLAGVLDGRAWRPDDLVKLGVIDSIGYREDALRLLGELTRLGARPPTVRLDRTGEARREWNVPRRIAVVYASGGIETGHSGNDLLIGPYMGSRTMAGQIERAFRNPEVRAVVLRIDSPGGSSVASDVIYHAAERMKRETKKPLIVSMAGAAASGGYHIAVPADRIFADRFTRTGSIGVLTLRYSLEGWNREHGVRQDDFDRGAFMRYWSTGRDWDARAQAAADSSVYREYRDFVDLVARGRGLSWDQADAAAQGRVWMGEDALERRLVDAIGGLEDAVAEARRRAGVPAEEKIEWVEYRRPSPYLLDRLVGSWVRDAWERMARLPEPGAALYWMDPEAVPVE